MVIWQRESIRGKRQVHLKSITKALTRQVREALLALPDDELVKTVEHWGALLQQMLAGDIEALEEALLVCGLQFKSTTTGQIYPSLAALLLAEPNFERSDFVIVDPQQLRTYYQHMSLQEFYHSIVPLAQLMRIDIRHKN
jgi:hypothetical protein